MSVKMYFKFDERRLVEAVRKANYSSLRRAGAYIRATARNAIILHPVKRRAILRESVKGGDR